MEEQSQRGSIIKTNRFGSAKTKVSSQRLSFKVQVLIIFFFFFLKKGATGEVASRERMMRMEKK